MELRRILSILKPKFPEVKKTSSRWVNLNCKFCQDRGHKEDTGLHFGINYQKGYTNCFKCGARYKLEHFLKIVDVHIDKDDFYFEEYPTLITKVKNNIEFPQEYINILDLFDPNYPGYAVALEYIDKRVGIDLALKLNVGFCSIGKYANRIIVPIFDANDNITYFIARAVYDFMQPKILNPFGERKSVLFNWNIAQKFQEIFIMEGVFGALTAFPYGVATLGKKITDEQLLAILRSNVNVVNIVLDGNAKSDAYKVADRILNLTSRVKIRVFELRDKFQPDDYNFEFLIRMKEHVPYYKKGFF